MSPKTDSDKKTEKKSESKSKGPSAYDKALTGLQDEMVKMSKRVTFLETEVNRLRNCRGAM